MNDPRLTERPRGHEPEGTNVLGVLLTAAGLLVALAVISLLVGAMVNAIVPGGPSPDAYTAMIEERRPPSSPGPLDDMPALRARLEANQRAAITTLGWVDRERGIVRIPIDDAMHRVAAQGLPDFSPKWDPQHADDVPDGGAP